MKTNFIIYHFSVKSKPHKRIDLLITANMNTRHTANMNTANMNTKKEKKNKIQNLKTRNSLI